MESSLESACPHLARCMHGTQACQSKNLPRQARDPRKVQTTCAGVPSTDYTTCSLRHRPDPFVMTMTITMVVRPAVLSTSPGHWSKGRVFFSVVCIHIVGIYIRTSCWSHFFRIRFFFVCLNPCGDFKREGKRVKKKGKKKKQN